MYKTWESSCQGIVDISDIEQFKSALAQNKRFFVTELNVKKQLLKKYLSEIDTKLIANTERLKNLQKRHFSKNEEKQLAITQQTHELKLIRRRRVNIMLAKIKLRAIEDKFCEKFNETVDRLINIYLNIRQQQVDIQSQGLSQETIQTFNLFTADESHVGDQCSVCMEDITAGRRMRRLSCDGHHCFCQGCIEGWFAKHNTCPLCRHAFC